jgi:hypothetical protein
MSSATQRPRSPPPGEHGAGPTSQTAGRDLELLEPAVHLFGAERRRNDSVSEGQCHRDRFHRPARTQAMTAKGLERGDRNPA